MPVAVGENGNAKEEKWEETGEGKGVEEKKKKLKRSSNRRREDVVAVGHRCS